MPFVPERITKFLCEQKPNSYCDACIRKVLRLKRPQQAQQVTSAGAAAGGFMRERGSCTGCQRDV